MSLYNLIHGVNPMAGMLLSALGITPAQVPRFRDCYWNGTHICIYTRTGGGYRAYYDEPNDENREGPWNSSLRAIEGFDDDEDDDFDSTYATFRFKPSERLKTALAAIEATDATPAQRWESFFDRLTSGAEDPQIKRVHEAVAPMVRKIVEALK